MTGQPKKPTFLSVALWSVQALLALLYIGTGIFKVGTPIATLATLWPWAGEYPSLVRVTGMLDLCGGLGLVLPTITRIKPRLMVLAALGVAVLQVCAIGFHVSRGEVASTPFNFVMLALALLIFWGRRTKAPTSLE